MQKEIDRLNKYQIILIISYFIMWLMVFFVFAFTRTLLGLIFFFVLTIVEMITLWYWIRILED